MDMEYPAFAHQDIFAALGSTFYDVVPTQYRTFCALNSLICQSTLKHFGIKGHVIPCEVWYADATHSYFIGVPVGKLTPDKWAGHAVCVAEGWLMDATLHHFSKEYGRHNVPDIAVVPTFGIASNMISRLNLGSAERMWWCHPPHDAVIEVPNEPADLVAKYGRALAARIETIVNEKMRTCLQASTINTMGTSASKTTNT